MTRTSTLLAVAVCAAGLRGADLPRFVPDRDELASAYQRGNQPPRPPAGVYKSRIEPHWFHDDTRFWYRNDLTGGTREFVVVDAVAGKRGPAFDHAKLAVSLSKAAGTEYKAERLPFDAIEFADGETAVKFKIGGTAWTCDLTSYECTKGGEKAADLLVLSPSGAETDQSLWPDGLNPDTTQPPAGPPRQPAGSSTPIPSADGKWRTFVKDENLFVRGEDGQEVQLSTDGKPGNAYALPRWSRDSRSIVAFRIEPGDRKEVYLVASSPAGGGRAKLETRPYALPGDKFPAYEVNVFDVAGKKQVKPDFGRIDGSDYRVPGIRWARDGRHFTLEKVDRGHQRFRVIEIDAADGQHRNLIDEQSTTFIWTDHGPYGVVRYLEKSPELIYESERDGWRHLYLIDAQAGTVKCQMTKGEWVVRGIERIDEEKRQVWFRACGKEPGQDPYFIHFYRVNFDGTGLVALTEGNGTHTVQYSPDRKFLIDTYSRADMAPVHTLRRVEDGKFVCDLETTDITELQANGWGPPEVFVAKGRDGKTDIWGLIHRPKKLDPAKKYPVIESIYAGPQDSFVPKAFSPARRFTALNDLGFIVVQIDGMGTANRSKAFHDVCWHNLKDAGFPDRILWHEAAAKKYPHYDASRVGIYGTSAGGQNAAGAVLFHPEFYKAAVAACGCHDNRMDKASWNEQWMGYPVGPHYAACSNIDNAGRLRGHLLLIVGELDHNVPPESTYRFVDALIKAAKDFEFVMVPGMDHSDGGVYGRRRLQDFFVRYLHSVEPPDHNGNVKK